MRQLTYLPGQAFGHFDAIVAAKYQPRNVRLTALRPQIFECYRRFPDNPDVLGAIAPVGFAGLNADDLQHCYTSSTAPLERLKAAIGNHLQTTDPTAAAMCQYCGLTHAPASFDHYLPKEIFPEYAVHSHNLVPSCERCNGLKDTKWIGVDNRRRIISFYFDAIPSRRFVIAEVMMAPRLEAEFRLSEDAADFEGLEDVIRNHFQELDLLRRFKQAAPAEFSERREELGPEVRAAGTAEAAVLLRRKAEQVSSAISANYWKVALLHAMAESEEFLNWCGET